MIWYLSIYFLIYYFTLFNRNYLNHIFIDSHLSPNDCHICIYMIA